jgi:glyoxylase-like metal-dependent hydrolase (beta-lactamase superfamily II)
MSDPFFKATQIGINRFAIPTPFAVGRVNAYLIEDEPLTLVDAGPNSGSSLNELEHQVNSQGYSLSDIELILLTHQHMDHLGLVGIVAERSQANVAMIEHAVSFVEGYPQTAQAEDKFATEIMLRHGIAEDVVTALEAVSQAFRGWGARVPVTNPLRDGDRITMRDRTLEVISRPGHSPTDTILYDRDRGVVLGGDHLLKHISSNPLLSAPQGTDKRPQALVTYLDSLAKTQAMEIEQILPGHGDPIDDHKRLIDERFKLHRRRAEKLYGLIRERPQTAYELAQALWGNVAVTQAYLTLSEVLGHTDILLNEGRVGEVVTDGVAYFKAV